MKSALSLTLIVCIVASALPVTAQAQVERPGSFDLRGPASTPATARPLARAVTREAVQLAAAGESTAGDAVQRSGKPVESKLAALFLPVGASDADANRSWDALVGTVKIGEKVIVTRVSSTSVEGSLLAIDAHSISVEQPGGSQTIERADVFRVRHAGVRTRHVVYGMLIGMAGGALALVVGDQHSSHPSTKVEAAVLGAIFVGLPFGALGGAVAPIGQPLYEAANVVRKTP